MVLLEQEILEFHVLGLLGHESCVESGCPWKGPHERSEFDLWCDWSLDEWHEESSPYSICPASSIHLKRRFPEISAGLPRLIVLHSWRRSCHGWSFCRDANLSAESYRRWISLAYIFWVLFQNQWHVLKALRDIKSLGSTDCHNRAHNWKSACFHCSAFSSSTWLPSFSRWSWCP